MGIKYPIVTSNFTANETYSIVPIFDPTFKIDGNPVLTSFTWTSKSEPYSSDVVNGNSISTKANNLPVIILDSTVIPYIINAGQTSTLSD